MILVMSLMSQGCIFSYPSGERKTLKDEFYKAKKFNDTTTMTNVVNRLENGAYADRTMARKLRLELAPQRPEPKKPEKTNPKKRKKLERRKTAEKIEPSYTMPKTYAPTYSPPKPTYTAPEPAYTTPAPSYTAPEAYEATYAPTELSYTTPAYQGIDTTSAFEAERTKEELNKLKSFSNHLTTEKSNLKNQINFLKNNNSQLNESIGQLNSKIITLKNNAEKVKANCEKRLFVACQTKDHEIANLKHTLDNTFNANKNLESNIASLLSKVKHLEKEKMHLTLNYEKRLSATEKAKGEEVANLKCLLGNTFSSNKNLESNLALLQSKIQHTEKEKANLASNYEKKLSETEKTKNQQIAKLRHTLDNTLNFRKKLEANIASLELKIKHIKNEKELLASNYELKLQATEKTKDQEVAKLKQTLEETFDLNKNLATENEKEKEKKQLTTKMANSLNTNNELQKVTDILNEEVTRLKQEITDSQTKYEEQIKLAALEKQQQFDDIQSQVNTYMKIGKESEMTIESIRKELIKSRVENEKLKEKYEGRIKAITEGNKKEQRKLKKNVKQFLAKNQELETQINSIGTRIERKQKDNSEIIKEYEEIINEITEYNEIELSKLDQKVEQYIQERKKLENEKRTLLAKIKELKNANKTLKGSVSEQKKKKTEMKQLADQKKTLLTKIKELEDANKTLKGSISGQKKKKTEMKQLADQKKTLLVKIKELEDANKTLNIRLAEQKHKKAEIKKLAGKKEALLAQIKELKNANKALNIRLAEQQKNKAEIIKKYHNITNEMEKHKNLEFTQLSKELDKSLKNNELFMNQNINLEKEIKQLKQSMKGKKEQKAHPQNIIRKLEASKMTNINLEAEVEGLKGSLREKQAAKTLRQAQDETNKRKEKKVKPKAAIKRPKIAFKLESADLNKITDAIDKYLVKREEGQKYAVDILKSIPKKIETTYKDFLDKTTELKKDQKEEFKLAFEKLRDVNKHLGKLVKEVQLKRLGKKLDLATIHKNIKYQEGYNKINKDIKKNTKKMIDQLKTITFKIKGKIKGKALQHLIDMTQFAKKINKMLNLNLDKKIDTTINNLPPKEA